MKKLIWALFSILIMIAVAFMIMDTMYGSIPGFQGDLNSQKELKKFNTFLRENKDAYVVLSVDLTETMKEELTTGIKKNPTVLLTRENPLDANKPFNYVIKQLEGGNKEFVFDEHSGKLEGLFKNYKEETVNGKVYTYLVPTNPKKLK